MLSIARNAAGDIYLGADGNLVMVSDEAAVRQNCEEAMRVRLGECIFDVSRGLPYFQAIFDDWKPALFIAAARKQLLTVPNVTGVPSFTLVQVDDTAVYTATIANNFTDSVLTITGVLTP